MDGSAKNENVEGALIMRMSPATARWLVAAELGVWELYLEPASVLSLKFKCCWELAVEDGSTQMAMN